MTDKTAWLVTTYIPCDDEYFDIGYAYTEIGVELALFGYFKYYQDVGYKLGNALAIPFRWKGTMRKAILNFRTKQIYFLDLSQEETEAIDKHYWDRRRAVGYRLVSWDRRTWDKDYVR